MPRSLQARQHAEPLLRDYLNCLKCITSRKMVAPIIPALDSTRLPVENYYV
jgi:hypothetical protein